MRVTGLISTLLLVVACGRTPMLRLRTHDAGMPRGDTAVQPDGKAEAADAAVAPPRPDAKPTPPDSSDPVACSALAALAGRGVLTPRHAKQVLFAKDRSAVVLRVASLVDAGTGDDVLLVHLPDGEVSFLAGGAVSIGWIDGDLSVLVRNGTGDLMAFPRVPGKPAGTLASNTCEHRISPDGARIIAYGYCDSVSATISAVETRTIDHWTLGRALRDNVNSGPNVVFSPGGAWIAYLEPPSGQDGSVSYGGTIHVVDNHNSSYALDSAGGASHLHFASDSVLLFTKERSANWTVDVRAHAVGKGDSSWVVAKGVGFDGRFEGRVSADGQWILAAVSPVPLDRQRPDALSSYSLGGREIALANDVYPFWISEVLWYSFAFAADDRHVVYQNFTPSSLGVSVVGRAGGGSSSLSADSSFVLPPAGSLVALPETRSTPSRLRLTDLDTTQDVASAETAAAPTEVTFTPDGLSVLFTEQAAGGTLARLRHLSGRTGAVTELARWNSNQLRPHQHCCNQPGPDYPIDPTGCFTVVDSDVDGGTRLILLP